MKITSRTSVLFIILIIVIVFAGSLRNDFAWDDRALIIKNPYIISWGFFTKVFKTQLYEGGEMRSNYYRPVQLVSYMIDYSIWRLNPFGYHFTSLILHIFNAMLVYIIIFAISLSPSIAFLTACLFGISTAISSVTFYIPARSDLLMALFAFLSILFFIRRRKGIVFYIASILSFSISLLCKEMAIMVPLLLLLIDAFLPPPRRWRWLAPYIAVLLVYACLRMTILNFSNSRIDFSFSATLPLWVRMLTDIKIILLYLRILILPFGLHMSWFVEPLKKIFQPEILLYITGFAAIVLILRKMAVKNKLIIFGALWFLIALLPVLNIYPISVLFGEGWLYVPSIGFFVVLSVILNNMIKPRMGKIFTWILVALLLIYYAFFTISYGKVWKDTITLLTNTLRYEKKNLFVVALAYNNLGVVYCDKGDFKSAIECCKKSAYLAPAYYEAYNNLAVAYIATGRPISAIRYLKKAISVKRDYMASYGNLGHLYNNMGLKDRAIEVLNKALSINPGYQVAYLNLGCIYAEKGDTIKAIEFLNKAIQIRDEDYYAHYYLGTLLLKNKNYKEALKEYIKASKLGQCDPDFYNKLANAYVKNKRFRDAELALMRSLALNGKQCEPYNNLGNLYSMFGRFGLAMEEYRKALDIEPDNTGIVDNIKKTKREWKQILRNRNQNDLMTNAK